MALIEARCAAKWTRDPTPVTVKVDEHVSKSVEVIIINEGYPDEYPKEEDEIIINEERSISGKLRANEDGSVVVTASPGDPNDPSYKFTQYKLMVPDQPSRDEPQPRCILLESQLESLKHHFLYWNLSGPTVKWQQLQKYDSNGPQIDINDDSDQKFVWVIPLERSNQFSLKTYNCSYYLAFGCDGKATLCKDSSSDQQNSIFRFVEL